MNFFRTAVYVILLLAWSGAAGREVVFIGLAGEGAPSIEQQFGCLLEARLAMIPGVHLVDNAEVKRLQSQASLFSYPAITSSLAAMLRRCVPDTSLVIWGMVKSCSIRPIRKNLIWAEIQGDLSLEMAIYSPSAKAYSFIGDIRATAVKKKGFNFWFGPIEEAIQVTAPERGEMLDSLQLKAVVSATNTLRDLIQHEKVQAAAAPPDSIKKPATPSDSVVKKADADTGGQQGR